MPEQRDIEIALRDSISSGLRQVGREIDAITRKMKEADVSGEGTFSKFNKGLHESKDSAEKAKESMGGLSGLMTGMSRTLVGATGLASGFIAVGAALESFAQKRVHMQMLSIDLGITNEQMSIMRRTLSRMGVDAGDQERLISGLGHTLKDAFRLGPYSPIMQQLAQMGESGFAGRLRAIVQSGDFKEAMDSIVKRYNELAAMGKPEAAAHFASLVGFPESVLKNWEEASKNVQAGYISEYKHSQEYLDAARKFTEEWEDWYNFIQDKVLGAFISIDKEMKKYDWKMVGPFGTIPFPSTPGQQTPGERLWPGGVKKSGTFFDESMSDNPKSRLGEYVKRGMEEEDKKTNRYLNEIADTLKIFENGGRGVGGGGGDSGGGGGGGGGSPSTPVPGGSVSGPAVTGAPRAFQGSPGLSRHASPLAGHSQSGSQLSGAQTAPMQQEVPLPRSEAATPAGTTNSKAANVRYNNPGAMYPGKAAQMFGTTGTGTIGGGHKIANFPTATHGAAANMMNLAMGYKGMKIGDALKKWSGGGRGAPAGYDPNQVITDDLLKDKKFMTGFVKAITGGEAPGKYPMTEEHWDQAFQMYQQRGPGDLKGGGGREGIGSAPSSGGDKGRPVGGGGKSFEEAVKFMKSRGGHDATTGRGEEAPPFNPEMAARLQAAGEAYEAETGKKANFGEMSRSVELQSDYYNRYKSGRGGLAAPPGRSRHGQGEATDIPRGGFLDWMHKNHGGYGVEFLKGSAFARDPVHVQMNKSFEGKFLKDREAVDGSLKSRSSGGGGGKATVKGEIDFSNMPTKVPSKGDEGKFKLLKVNANPQGSKDLEGMLHPGDAEHTPYVP